MADKLDSYLKQGSCVDSHTIDQLLCFMACAEGVSAVRCIHPAFHDSKHVQAAIGVCAQVLGVDFSVSEPDENQTCIIHCYGHAIHKS